MKKNLHKNPERRMIKKSNTILNISIADLFLSFETRIAIPMLLQAHSTLWTGFLVRKSLPMLVLILAMLVSYSDALAQCGYIPGEGCPNTNYANSFANSTSNAATIEYDNYTSAYHGTAVRRFDGLFSVWGQNMANVGTNSVSGNALNPIILNSTNFPALGTGNKVYKVTGGSAGGNAQQFVALATNGLYAWGYEGYLLDGGITSSSTFQKITINGKADGLPTGVSPSDVKMMTGTVTRGTDQGTICIVTCSGAVWVLAENANMRGNGGTGSATVWAQVTTSGTGNPALSNIVAARVAGGTAMALDASGNIWTWGITTFLGNNSAAAARNRATQMTKPTGTIKMIGVTASNNDASAEPSSYYALMTDGNLYAMGENSRKQLGDWSTTDRTGWVQPRYTSASGPVMNNIQWISPNEHDGRYAGINVITTTGVLYSFGWNEDGMLGRGATSGSVDPGIPNGLTASNVVTSVHTGGHTSMITEKCQSNFGYVGHRIDGSMGNGSNADAFEGDYSYATAYVPICGTTTPSVAVAPDYVSDGTYCTGNTYQIATSPSGGTVTASSSPSGIFSLTGTPATGYLISLSGTGSVTLNYQAPAPGGCPAPAVVSTTISVSNCAIRLSGTVKHDADGPSDGINDGTTLPNLTGMNAMLTDAQGKVVAVAAVNPSSGAYSFTGVPNGSYTVSITTNTATVGSPTPAVALPTGWINTGEVIGTGTGNDGLPSDGILAVTLTGTGNITNMNFGIQQSPTAVDDQSLNNNYGTPVIVNVLTNDSDPAPGTIAPTTVTLKNPGTATNIVTDASGDTIRMTIPGQGIWSVDTVTGAITFTPQLGFTGNPTAIQYTVDDNAGFPSNPASVTITYLNPVQVAGTVFNDANGNTIINGGENFISLPANLYTYLVNSSNIVVDSSSVAANGTYTLDASPNQTYTVVLSTIQYPLATNVTSTPINTTPPPGWITTGENTAGNTGSGDSMPNGILQITLGTNNATQQNFGLTKAGYIYIHKKALSEESSISFPFTVSGGTTTVPNFNLNDLNTQNSVSDLGASQDGTLWATGENSYNLLYRNPSNSQWQAANNSAGTALINSARRLDGGENGTVYWISSTAATFAGGTPFFFDGTTHTQISSSGTITDIASPWNGTVYFINGGNVFFKAVPTSASAAVQLTTSGNFSRIDGDPTTGDVIAMRNDGNVFRINSSGTATNLEQPIGNAINRDVAVTSNGTIFGSTQDLVYQYSGSGTTWLAGEATSRKYASRMTGGLGKLVWGTTNELNVGDISKNIYTRVESSTEILWLNDERVRLTSQGNSIMIPVAPGTYTITELVPAGWDLTDLQVFDPTGNSTKNLVGNTATVNVADGETVGLVYENILVQPFAMTQSCTAEYTYDFGTGAAGTYGGALTGQTSYHYQSGGQSFSNNYMVIGNASLLFPGAANLNDHTANNGQGRMMAIDANNENDAFFRRRFRGVIPGASYEFSAWIANINVGAAIKPNVTFEVVNPANYNIIQSYNTGNITTAGWNKYGITFVAVDTTFDLIIRNAGFGGSGNDLALDDIRFALIPPTDPFTTVANSDCNQSFGSITVTSPLGASFEYSRDSVSWQSSPVFNGLTPGPYRILARYAGSNGCIVSKRDTVLLSICGNVFLDNNALTDATVNGAPTNLNGALKAVLYNVTTGRVDSIVNVSSTGTYSFLGTAGRNYTVYLTSSNTVTTGQTAVPPTTLPLGYINTGENIDTASGNDGTVNGILPLGVRTLSVNQANFGIRCGTNAGSDRTACQFGTATMAAAGVGIWTAATGNPGTASITNTSSPTTTITNFSQPGTYLFIWTNGCPDTAAIVVTAAPNAGTDGSTTVCDYDTSLISLSGLITGEQSGGAWTRLSGTGGTFNAASGTFRSAIFATTSTFRYIVTGSGACSTLRDTSFVTVNINACRVDVTGRVFNDANGNTIINAGENYSSLPAPLYVYLVDSTGLIVDSANVLPNGTYTLNAVPNRNYTIELSTVQYPVGGNALTTTINNNPPTGLVNSGENGNNNTGTGDGLPDGKLTVSVGTNPISQQNFGLIDRCIPASGLIDSDGDGVTDVCDLDDDNDGIPDTDESSCLNSVIASYPNGQWQYMNPSVFGYSFTGTPQIGLNITKDVSALYGYPANSGAIVITVKNANIHPTANAFFNRGDLPESEWKISGTMSSWIVAEQSNKIYRNQILRINAKTHVTSFVNITPPTPDMWESGVVANEYFLKLISSVTADSTRNDALFGIAMIDNNEKNISFSTNDTDLAHWTTYFVKLHPECDFDKDGIPNRLDKDSDNDGCVDAIEGSGNFSYGQLTASGSLSGSVSTSGVPTVAGSGQGIGTSLDSTINACNTTNAINDENSTFTGTSAGGNVLTNDFDIEGNTQTFGSFLNPTSTGNITSGATVSGVDNSGNVVANAGTLTFDASGNYTFTPAAGFTGVANIPYRVTDNGNPSAADTALLQITVSPLPTTANSVIANNDEYTTQVGSTVTGNVITNDADPQGNSFTVTTFRYDSNGDGTPDATCTVGTPQAVGGVSLNGTPVTNAGSLTLNSNGTFTFVPTAGFVGEVDLTYTICDNGTPQACSQTSITVNVVPDQNGTQNDPPVAGDDFAYTNINTPTTGSFVGNDRDLNDNPLSVSGTTINTGGAATPIQTLTTAQGGTVVMNANGTYTYTPPTSYTGPDRVVYEICDVTVVEPQPLCAQAIIHLLVGVKNTTNAVNDENSTFINTPVTGGVMTNDFDLEGNTQTFGSFLNPLGTAPISSGSTVSGFNSNGVFVLNAGTLAFDANGNYTFTPAAGFTGNALVNYTICDDAFYSVCDTATLAITVSRQSSTSNVVIANNDEYFSFGNISGNVKDNDSDPQGDNFQVTTYTYDSNGDGTFDATGAVGSPTVVGGINESGIFVANAGTLTLNADGTFSFVPNAGFKGEVQAIYTIEDDGSPVADDLATLSISILTDQNGTQNDPPIAGDDFGYTSINTPTTGSFVGNDRDLNGNPLSVNGTTINTGGPATPIQTLTTAQGGTVVMNANGTYTYTPPTGYTGPDRVVYEICDVTAVEPQPLCAQATIHLLVGIGYKISGTVWNDGNGMTDGYVNGSNGGTNADNKLYAVLTDTDGNVIQSVAVNTDGTYEFVNVPGNRSLLVLLDTIARSSGEIVTTSSLPQGWVSTGENIGTQAGRDNNINGISAVIPPLTTNVEDVQFGIQRPPVADAKIYNVANVAFTEGAPAGYPVPSDFERFFTITTFSQYLTGNGNGGLLTGRDAEDCPNAQQCSLGNTFKLESLLPSTILYYDFGGSIGIIRLEPGDIITGYEAENLVIYAREGAGMSDDPVGFSYSLVDAAGFASPPVSYTILTESALPVELLYFTATVADCKTILNWATASELNNDYFELQRSADAKGWMTIGKIAGNGTSNARNDYNFEDLNAFDGMNYYRLKQVDFDGTAEFHRIIQTENVGCNYYKVSMFPNPAQSILNVKIDNSLPQKSNLNIVDVSGRIIRTLINAENLQQIDVSDMPAGSYFLQIKTNERQNTYPFIIVR